MGLFDQADRRVRLLADLAKWQSARLDAGPDSRPAIAARIDRLLEALWRELPPERKHELIEGEP